MEGAPAPEVAWASDRSLRVAWPEEPAEDALRAVRAAARAVRSAHVPALVDVVPAYATLLLLFDAAALDPARAEAEVGRALAAARADAPAPGRVVTVPVCPCEACGPDLAEVARLHGLDREEAGRLHREATYTVAFLGFAPGFPYLTGLPAALATPRLARPRLRVPAGSVALAGDQAGIYPRESPGGWRLVGRTPLVLFDPSREPSARLAPGDRVRFVAAPHDDVARAGGTR